MAKKPSGNKIFSSPREEFCLSMLIQYPQLIAKTDKLKREYFTGSENAELFALLSDSSDPQSIEDLLDAATREHYERLKAKTIDSSGLETKLKECILLLKESHLRRLLQNQKRY